MSALTKVFRECMTGIDGESHDIGRWSWLICTGAVIGAAGANWYHNNVIDLVSFGTALSAIAVSHGIAIGAKKATEPVPPDEAKQ